LLLWGLFMALLRGVESLEGILMDGFFVGAIIAKPFPRA
jgi:hypothetical protein